MRRIAEDALGSLWEAQDTELGAPITLRLLREGLSRDQRLLEGWQRAMRAVHSRLTNKNVARIINLNEGEQGPTQFVVMEPLRGETLAQRLEREGRLPPREATRIALEVTGALEAAHSLGLVHGALQPERVFLAEVFLSDEDQVKVMDFGLAGAAPPETTREAALHFLTPEQAAGAAPTPASDVYALAAMTYRMMAGTLPARLSGGAWSPRGAPLSLSETTGTIPEAIVHICRQALDPDPRLRPTTRIFARTLSQFPQNAVSRQPLPTGRAEEAEAEEEGERKAAREEAEKVAEGEAAQATRKEAQAARNAAQAARKAAQAARNAARAARNAGQAARTEAQAARKQADEEAARRKAIEEEVARRKTAGEEAKRKDAEEEAALERAWEEETRRKAGEEARNRAPEEEAGREAVKALFAAFATAALLLVVTVSPLWLARDWTSRGDQPSAGARPPNAPAPEVAGRILIKVPRVLGLTAFEARQEIMENGLELGRAIGVRGEPGIVLRTSPPPGSPVPAETEILLYVGAAPDRS